MNYIELCIEKKSILNAELEIITAILTDSGFEGFMEEAELFKAYIPDHGILKFQQLIEHAFKIIGKDSINYDYQLIHEKNWNEEWEKNYSPIYINDTVLIKAPFHRINDLEVTIIIEPKMSFGTGHHETTRLMITAMLAHDFRHKQVLDIGCGSGILGIFAKKRGAEYVMSVDNDKWAVNNCLENFVLNEIIHPYDIILGDVSSITSQKFDIILANINRNILVADMHSYSTIINKMGSLILSGILSEDQTYLTTIAKKNGFSFLDSYSENNWISLKFTKKY